MAKKSDSISVIVPSLNGRKIIGALIESIYKQNYPGKIEIIVTDDGSTDGTSAYIKSHWPKVRLIRFSQSKGSAPALNAAAKIATCGFILATNDDVTFGQNSFQALVDCWHSRKYVGIVTGKMFGPGRKFAIPGFKINHYLGYHPYDFKKRNKIREADWAVGACLFIKKDLLKKIGYFDPGFIFCGEEYDISFQVKRLGYKILYAPNAVFYHLFRRNLHPNFDTLFAHYRGKFRYMFKNAQGKHLLVFLPVQLLIVPVYFIGQGKLKHIFAMYKALFWNIINLRETIRARINRPQNYDI